jgi:hypothetical protein
MTNFRIAHLTGREAHSFAEGCKRGMRVVLEKLVDDRLLCESYSITTRIWV